MLDQKFKIQNGKEIILKDILEENWEWVESGGNYSVYARNY